jgi:hypothetical protein
MDTARAEEPERQPADDGSSPDARIAVLELTNAELRAVVAEQAAQLNALAGPVEWLALQACDRGGFTSETLRQWCETGEVDAYQRQRGARWFVNTRSLAAHLARLGLAKAIRSA